MIPIEASDAVHAQRYRWFCSVGVYLPTLNDPAIIHQTATAEQVDRIITAAMSDWAQSKLNQLKK